MRGKKSKNACGGHLVFQNEAKIYGRHVFVGINIICKFGISFEVYLQKSMRESFL